MKVLAHPTRSVKVILFVLLVLALTASAVNAWGNYQQQEFLKTLKGKAPTRKGEVKLDIINSSPIRPVSIAAAPGGFTPQTRMGFAVENEWEPAIASDRFGHVYILYAQYSGVPGCPNCSN